MSNISEEKDILSISALKLVWYSFFFNNPESTVHVYKFHTAESGVRFVSS